MPLLPSSPRARRRLLALGIALTVAAAAVVTALVLQRDHTIHDEGGTFSVATQAEPKPVPLSARDRRAINDVLSRFVRTAVARRNVAASYDLVTPSLRSGMSRRQWARGNIPVFEFPNEMRRVEVFHYDLTLRNDVLGEVIVLPKDKSQGPIGFTAELLATGNGAGRRWRVDSFAPAHVYAPLTSETEAKAQAKATAKPKAKPGERRAAPRRQPEPLPVEDRGRLSAKWLLVPLALFSLIVLIPVGIGLREWVLTLWVDRQLRAQRRLPDLPPRKS